MLTCGATACVTPVMRPMRTHEGVHVTMASGSLVGGKDDRMCYEGCDDTEVGTVNLLNLDVRYGRMLTTHTGVSLGVIPFAGENIAKVQKGMSLAIGYAQFSHQNQWGSLSAGLDFGANLIAPVVGLDVQPWGGGGYRPNLAAYFRYAQPIQEDDTDTNTSPDHARHDMATWDAGVTLRSGRWLMQYTYTRNTEGRTGLLGGIEGEIQASAWHSLFFGFSFRIGGPAKDPYVPQSEPVNGPPGAQ